MNVRELLKDVTPHEVARLLVITAVVALVAFLVRDTRDDDVRAKSCARSAYRECMRHAKDPGCVDAALALCGQRR
jgi:hypothetical protein